MIKRYTAFILATVLTILSLPIETFAVSSADLESEKIAVYKPSADKLYDVYKGKAGTEAADKYYYIDPASAAPTEVPGGVAKLENITDSTLKSQQGVLQEYYSQAYTSMVKLAIDSGNSLEQIELQLVRFAALDKSTDTLAQINTLKDDMTTLVSNVESSKTNNKSIFKTDNVDLLLGPVKVFTDEGGAPEGSIEKTKSGIFREALAVKADSMSKLIKDLSDNQNLQYSATCYVLNVCQILNEFSYTEGSGVPDKINELLSAKVTDNKTLIELKSALEEQGAKNLLSSVSDNIFENTESSFTATRLYKAFLQDMSDQGDYYYTQELLAGKALSAAYVPLRTNLYKNPYLDIPDIETFKSFNSTYGDLRKAVLISTSNKSVSQMFITGSLGSFRPATLRDFVENVSDEKVFVVDRGYYNSDEQAEHDWTGDERLDFTLGSDDASRKEEETEKSTDDSDSDSSSEEEEEVEEEKYDPWKISGKSVSDLGIKDGIDNYEANNEETPPTVQAGHIYPVGTVVTDSDGNKWTAVNVKCLNPKTQNDTGSASAVMRFMIKDNGEYYVSEDDSGYARFFKKGDSSAELQATKSDDVKGGLGDDVKSSSDLKDSKISKLGDVKFGNEAVYVMHNLAHSDDSYTHAVDAENQEFDIEKSEYFSLDSIVAPSGTYIKRPMTTDSDGNMQYSYYVSYKNFWYALDAEGKLGSALGKGSMKYVEADGKEYWPEIMESPPTEDQLKAAYGAKSIVDENDKSDSSNDSTQDSAPKAENTNTSPSVKVDSSGARVEGENLYKDLIEPKTVYAANSLADYVYKASKEAADKNLKDKNTTNPEEVPDNWINSYPDNLNSLSIDNGFLFGSLNNDDLVESFFKYDDIKDNIVDGSPLMSSYNYYYHWLPYAEVTNTEIVDQNKSIVSLLNDKDRLYYILKWHFNYNSNLGGNKNKTSTFFAGIGSAVTKQMQSGNATIAHNLRDVLKQLADEKVTTNCMADFCYATYVKHCAFTTNVDNSNTWAVWNCEKLIKNNKALASSNFTFDSDDVLWLFATPDTTYDKTNSGVLSEVSNIKSQLAAYYVNRYKDSFEVFEEHLLNYKSNLSSFDGNIINNIMNWDSFCTASNITTQKATTDLQNAWSLTAAAMFGGDVSSHSGYSELSPEARQAILQNLPTGIQRVVEAIINTQEFLEEAKSTLSGEQLANLVDSLDDLSIDTFTQGVKDITEKWNSRKGMEMDNTSNTESDLFQASGTAAKLTESDVDALKDSIKPEAIKEVFKAWYNKPNHFTLGINPQEIATLLGSAQLRDSINLNVESNLNSANNNFNSWYGIAFALDCMNHSTLADYVVGFEDKPIFRSAPDIGDDSYQDAVFNYMLLSNIAETYPVRWDAVLDLDSPVFIDIYGNIVTESGLVIIPFAANSTLHSKIPLMSNAFLHSYGSSKTFTLGENTVTDTPMAYVDDKYYFSLNNEKVLNRLSAYPAFSEAGLAEDNENSILIPNEETLTWDINPIAITTDKGAVSLNKIDTTDLTAASVMYNIAMSLYTDNLSEQSNDNAYINIKSDISNILFQVMRGSYLENIDYQKEGLATGINYNPTIISQANKYETLTDQLSYIGNNSLISVPDITTLPGVEYLVYFVYKVLLLVFVFYLLFQIYLATVGQNFGISTIGKIFLAFLLISVTVLSQPFIYKLSYYYTNRSLLQDEAELITMLNREKKLNNVELGVIDARNFEQESKIMLKITEVDVDIFDWLSHIVDAASVGSLSEYYALYVNRDIETYVDEYEQRGTALYYDVSDLYDTSIITIDQNTDQLMNVTTGEPAVAFRLPYYAILDYLVRNVNDYNAVINSYDYGIISSGDGSIRTIGLTDRYFRSSAFGLSRDDILHHVDKIPNNVDEDILKFAENDRAGIFAMYGITGVDARTIWDQEALDAMHRSAWYADNLPNPENDNAEVEALANYLDNEAITWINEHKSMLGRVTDETILKSLALHLSLAYNRYLQADGPQYFEIDTISTNDILRCTIVDKDSVMTGSPFTYPKFVLVNAGLPGIYLSAILTMVTFLLTFVKPITTVLTFLVLIFSLIVFRLILNQKTEAIKGVIKHGIILCGLNISYSLLLKMLLLLPGGIPAFVRILIMIIIHMLFIAAYVWLLAVIIFNWKDFGNVAFSNMIHMRSVDIKTISTGNIQNNNTGRNLYERLKNSDKFRRK